MNVDSDFLIAQNQKEETFSKKTILLAFGVSFCVSFAVLGIHDYRHSDKTIIMTASNSWGKGDYENYINGCFSTGDSTAAGSYDYHNTWNGAVNQCFGSVFCSGGYFNAPNAWGKQDYINFEWNCYGTGDSAAAGSYNYHDTWNGAVNTCLASYC